MQSLIKRGETKVRQAKVSQDDLLTELFDARIEIQVLLDEKTKAKEELDKLIISNLEKDVQILRLNNSLEKATLESRVDPLTGLLNRRGMEEKLTIVYHSLARGVGDHQFIIIIMFDLDHFKDVNDTYSHATGDMVLQRVSSVIKANFYRGSDFCARTGGEELMVSCLGDITYGLKKAEHVRAAIEKNCNICMETDSTDIVLLSDNEITMRNATLLRKVTASIGVTVIDTSLKMSAPKAIDEGMNRGDAGVYASKGLGRNKVFPIFGNAEAEIFLKKHKDKKLDIAA